MKCPSCANSKIITYDTRRIEDMVVRKRKCLACDDRFYTLEQYMSEDELEEVQQLKKKIIVYDPRSESQSEGKEAA
jgi:transcriptional regulator NrdR family protein